MDPISSFSLASSIIQVIDFSTKLISKGYDIYKSPQGTSAENVDTEVVAKDLRTLAAKLKSGTSDTRSKKAASNGDEALSKLSTNCKNIADELLEKLNRLKIFGKHRKWRSARHALKSVYGRDDLEQLKRRLDAYRNEINLHITVSLRQRMDLMSLQQSQRFNDLDSTTKEIMQTLLDTKTARYGYAPVLPFELCTLDTIAVSSTHAIGQAGGVDVNAQDSQGLTALHWAAAGGYSLIVQTLLNNQAKLEVEGGDGSTALHYAARGGKWAVVRTLLSNGARKQAENDYYRTPIDEAQRKPDSADHQVCLWLFKHGHDVRATDEHQDTLLLVAAYRGFWSLAEHLLDRAADIEATGGAGMTPLLIAAAHGHVYVVRLLLERGARIEVTDRNGSTALIRAAWRGRKECVEVLLDEGANIEAENSEQLSSLHVAYTCHHTDVVRVLLERGAKAIGQQLFKAAQRGMRQIIYDLVVIGGVLVDFKSDGGMTPLMAAASRNRFQTVEVLLELGACIEARREDGATALWISCEFGNLEAAKVLLENDANIESKTQEKAHTSLTKATQLGHLSIVRLLLDRGADVESCNSDGCTALMETVWANQFQIAHLLISKGADMEARDKKLGGYTPIIRAASSDLTDIVELLVNQGADLEARTTTDGMTALAKAICGDKVAAFSSLLYRGADTETKDHRGWTPLMHAASLGNKLMVEWLLKYGAFRGAKDAAGVTAIELASKAGYKEIVRMLE